MSEEANAKYGVWLTRADRSALLQRQPEPLRFDGEARGGPGISIDAERPCQTMEGFGFALTGGSAWLVGRLPPSERRALLQELFSPAGIGVSCLRLSVGASDLSARAFSYDDPPAGGEDWELRRFDLLAGDPEVVPLLREILAVNPGIRLIASPWSAPAWMKTNRQWVGGALRAECQPVYARYLAEYLKAMRGQGVAVHALTVQNEPLNPHNEPSMAMAAEEQAAFIKHHLGPALRGAGLGEVEIYCWDHNCDRPDYPLAVLADPGARAFTAGAAWHLYGGDISALSEVHQAHPDKKMIFTEQWVGRDGQFAGDLAWHVKNVLVGACRNWGRIVLEWNLASDPECGPRTPGGAVGCLGALTLGDGVSRNVAYYVIAHAAKFVPPGSVRLPSGLPEGLPNAAFKTPEGAMVLVALNEGAQRRDFAIEWGGRAAAASLPAGSVGTYVWPA